MDITPLVPQGSQVIHGYGPGMFRIAGVVHAGIGKASFDEAKLVENLRAFVDAVSKAKPSGSKGAYLKKVSLSSTMGPGVSVDLTSATGN